MKSKKNIIKLLALHKNDVGSTEVQIGILSEKIKSAQINMIYWLMAYNVMLIN